ncbi:MAG: MATE family efflux transporter, partial [Alphaproteobacteria bacterium]|nr:MATE family efflux transporter [Alphaproteobacteria bacterium]
MTFVTRHIANNFHVFAQSKEEYRKLLKIATPLSLGYLGHMAIGTTDVLMIGQLGAAPLAASAIVVSIYYTLYLLLTGIIVAITPIASQALGARQARTARRAVRQGMWVALTLSIPGLFLLWHSDKLFSLTGQTKELIPLATDYMHYYMWGMLSGLMFDALRCFMVALGRPQPILVITTIGIIANAILNYALIFGNFGAPEMGLMGAGISSSVVTFLMFLICAFFVATRLPYRRYHVFNRIWKPDWEIYFRIFRLGIPIGGSMMLEQSMYSVSTLLAGRIGAIEAASHSIAMALVNIVYVVSLGISEATTSRVGFNVGRQDSLGVKKAAYAGISTAMGFMFVSAIGVIFFRHELTSYFIGADVSDAAFVLTIAVHLVIVGMLFEFVDATQLGIRGSLHGMNDVKVTFYVSLLGYTVGGTFLAFYLSTYTDLGVYGIWYG